MKYAYYDKEPLSIEAVGNGSYLYRWAKEQVTVIIEAEERQTMSQWRCYEVVVWATLTENKLTEAVINAMWGAGVEQKLFNDFQAAQLGVLGEEFKQPYIDYLEERKAVKEQIAKDFKTFAL